MVIHGNSFELMADVLAEAEVFKVLRKRLIGG